MRTIKFKGLPFHFFVILFGLFMIYPLLWMLSASFKLQTDIFTGFDFFPKQPTVDNYINGWKGVSGYSFGRFFYNSMFIAVLCIIGNIISCSMAAYAFAKLKFKLNKILFSIMLLTLMLPFHVKLIPQYIIFMKLGWVNTFLPFIVPRFFAVEGFFIFLLVQFMRTISNELLDAPRIDGCNTFDIYVRFMLPLSVPALVTVAIFTFIWTWNDFFSQMIYLSAPAKFTVSLALRMFVDSTGQSSWGSLFAMSCLSLVPLFIVFIVFQRYLIEGITTGSLKG
ncbi:MAG: carbohydrate ABC transporter permease [Treponema sp.]|nr:carbohydrate ABC transporter permease [Treponema sp.]